MKKLLLLFICLYPLTKIAAQTASDCHFIPAPYPVTILQPDGSGVQVVGKGSSEFSRQETIDGYTILKNQQGYYEYATKVNGRLAPSGLMVSGNIQGQSSAGVTPAMLGISRHLEEDQPARAAGAIQQSIQAASMASGITPSSGDVNILVILVDFDDYPHQYALSDYQKVLEGPMDDAGKLSFKEYYKKASYGQLNFHVDITGWYRAEGSISDYGKQHGYGPSKDLVIEAVQQANKTVDFTRYDNNNDGHIDGVVVLQAGPGAEEGSRLEYIWSHKGYISSQTVDGKILDQYCIIPGVRSSGIVDIGVIAHEVGHLLGQPDLYDISNQTEGVGYWDMMGTGSWAGRGHYPSDFSAWTKDRWGWIDIQDITDQYDDYQIAPAIESSSNYYRINTLLDNEYFLLEYRSKNTWEQGVPGSGLAIWHINDAGFQYTGIPKSQVVLDLEEANGEDGLDNGRRGSWDDLFGIEFNEFGKDSWPNSRTNGYDEKTGSDVSGIALSNINLNESKNQVSFTYFNDREDEGQLCGNPVAAGTENTMTSEVTYFRYTMPKRGRLVLTTEMDVDFVEAVVADNCEAIADYYSAYFGFFEPGEEFRTPTYNKGDHVMIKIGQYETDKDHPFVWKLSVENADVNKSDSLAVVAVYNSLLNKGWDTDYKSMPMPNWPGVEVENQRVTYLDVPVSESKKNLTIPDDLYKLTSLKSLSIRSYGDQKIKNSITSDISKLKWLSTLDIKGVSTEGLLDRLTDFKDLEILYIDGGKSKGALPSDIDQLTKLRIFRIIDAKVQSTIPASLGNIKSLESIELYDNELTGSIPSSLGSLKNMFTLDLHNNKLTGALSAKVVQAPSLNTIDISVNQLDQVPNNLLTNESLSSINLANNKITNLPTDFEGDYLYYLNLSHNKIGGKVPEGIKDLNIEHLDLSYNQLEGHMPSFRFSYMADISHNRLSSIDEIQAESYYYDEPELRVAYNQLSFDDLLLNQDLYPCNCNQYEDQPAFWATKQDSVHLKKDLTVQLGTELKLSLNIDEQVEGSEYKWFRNGKLVKTTRGNTLSLKNFNAEMAGAYHCEVSNIRFEDGEEKVVLYYDNMQVRSAGKLTQQIAVEKVGKKVYGDNPFNIIATNNTGISLSYTKVEGPISLKDDKVTIMGTGNASVKISAKESDLYEAADTTISFTIGKSSQSISFEQPEDVSLLEETLPLQVAASSQLPVKLSVKKGKVSIENHTLHLNGAGKVVIEASQAGNENYESAKSETISFSIEKGTQKITLNPIDDKTYGDRGFAVSGYSSSGLPVTWEALSENIRVDENQVSILAAGKARLRATQPGNDDYQPAEALISSFNIGKATQEILLSDLEDQNLEDASVTLEASVSSGLPLSLSVEKGEELVKVENQTIYFLATGEVSLAISQAGNDNYLAADSKSLTFNIYQSTKKSQVISVDSEVPEKPELFTPYSLSATASSGLPTVVQVEGPGVYRDQQITFMGAGEVTVSISQAGNEEYHPASKVAQVYLVNKKTQKIAISPMDEVAINSEENPYILDAFSSSGLPVTVKVIEGEAKIDGMNLVCTTEGTVTLEFLQPGNDEYQGADPVYLTLVVTESSAQKNLQQISYSTLDVLTYGDAPRPLEALATSGLPVTYSYSGPIEVRHDSLYILGAGTAKLILRQAGNEEFQPTNVSLDLDIAKADQVIAIDADQINDTTFQLTAYSSANLPVTIRVIEGEGSIVDNMLYTTSRGEIILEASQAGNENFTEAIPIQKKLEVNIVLATPEEIQEIAVRYFPNPVVHHVSLSRDISAKSNLILYDAYGRKMHQQEWNSREVQIDMSAFTAGTYMLSCQSEGKPVKNIRLLKQ